MQQHQSKLESVLRALALTLVVLFFMFPIFWILLMSLQTNETILRVPPSVVFEPTLANYKGIITGKLETSAASLEINFLGNLWNSIFLSVTSVTLALLLGVPAAYAFARLKFKGSEDIAFTLLSFRFAPPQNRFTAGRSGDCRSRIAGVYFCVEQFYIRPGFSFCR